MIFFDDDDSVAVNQTAFSLDRFNARYPRFAFYAHEILKIHRDIRTKGLGSPKWQRFLQNLTAEGMDDERRNLDRTMPGEFGQIVATVGTEVLVGPLVSGFDQNKSARDFDSDTIFTSVRIPSGTMSSLLRETVDANVPRAQPFEGEIEIMILHTHPGFAAPLGMGDQRSFKNFIRRMKRRFPDVSIKFIDVALAMLEVQGDLIFVQERTIRAKRGRSKL